MDFPVSSRFARTLGPKVVGTTTKFHVTWEDFHSLKNLPALEFEIFRTVAQGASCSIGDQLHPRGMLDAETYELVGKVYGQLKECKPSLDECVADVDIAGLHPEEFLGFELQKLPRATQGIMRMLSEGGHQFNIIDTTQSLEPYKLVILPDFIRVDAQFPLKEWGLNVASQGPRDDKGELARGRAYRFHDFTQYTRAREKLQHKYGRNEHPHHIHGMDVDDG